MNTEFEKVFRDAYDALIGKNKDVYPCREDVPAELWGKPIVEKSKDRDTARPIDKK